MQNHEYSSISDLTVQSKEHAYPVEQALEKIAELRFPCGHDLSLREEVHKSNRWAHNNETGTDHPRYPKVFKEGEAVCESCQKGRIDAKTDLMERLQEAFAEGKIKLWNVYSDRLLRPSAYSTPQLLAQFSTIFASDLIEFCQSEKLTVSFGQLLPTNAPQEAPAAIEEQPLLTKFNLLTISADYIQLANAFMVDIDEDTNRNWFKLRCSEHSKYKAFASALAAPGERGGKCATFWVVMIAEILNQKKNKDLSQLRARVARNFPAALDEFDYYFGIAPDSILVK